MAKRTIILSLCALLCSLVAYASQPMRTTYNINDNWRFYDATAPDGGNADIISLPHTWNNEPSEGEYLRTTANYTRELFIPVEWQNKRLFLRFGGVQSVADVLINGRYVGSHEGGFTAFTLEITDRVKFGADNFIRVIVSNAMRSDILPISSDMDLAGGIYRDVELIVTRQNIISPLHHSSSGVYVVQQSVTEDVAKGVVRLHISAPKLDHASLTMRIVGEDGYEVERRTIRNAKLQADKAIEIPFEIANPELWSPASPSLYRVEVTLGDERAPEDKIVITTGLRSISVNDDNRLCINGKVIDVRGVNLPHDRAHRGTVASTEDIDADLDMVADLGANAIRSLLGPHATHLYDRCDREGTLVWIDMPFSRSPVSFSDICYLPMASFRNNGHLQLEEIIAQNFNHPSVVMWGLFEQVWQRGDDVVEYVRELNEQAHRIDPSRLTVGCSSADGAINFITDLIVFRQSVGYMKGSVEDVAVWCRQLSSNKAWSQMRYGVCYGEEGNPNHRADRIDRAQRGTRLLPERRQTYMHERYADIISESGIFWGVWLNAMFDYASSRRPYGLNYSGLVGHDHATKKDAYYLYRAIWNDTTSTLHIAGSRRDRERNTPQHIDLYSSTGTPVVMIEGDTVDVRRVARGQYRVDSLQYRGHIEVVAIDSLGTLNTRAEINITK